MRELKTFGKQLAKKHALIYMSDGAGTVVGTHGRMTDAVWDINMRADYKLTQEQARQLAVSLTIDFWKKVSEDPIFDAYLKLIHSHADWRDPILSPKRFGIKVAFWDSNFDRYPPPYISQIKVFNGTINYYRARSLEDPTLQDPITETFEQAFSLANRAAETPH